MKQKRGFILIAVVVFLCMIIPVQAKGNAETNSKNKSVYYNGHTYRRYDMETNWNEAKLYCENFGGHLATITNSAEQKAVHDLLAGASYESYWLGGYADKKWQWITGEKFDYSNWAAGEPNGGLNGMRLQIYSSAGGLHSTGSRGHWDDTWGDGDHGQGIKSQGFICEWESIISTENKQGSYNGHKYQIFDGNFKTWEAAAKYCRSIGGYLAVIDDMGENKYLYNWIVSQGYMTAYFGLHDITGNGDWRDAENNPIKFFNWASGEPNDSNEVYGMFYWKYTDGKWNDAGNAADTNEAVFICEWGEKKNISESKIKVTLNANGGTFDSKNKKKNITVVSGKNYGSLPTPKRSGYNFNGWYTKKSGGSKVQASTKVTSKKKHTLYAHWAKKVISYKITLDGNGGEPKTQQYSVTYNKTYGKLPTPKRIGYNFKGWYTKNSGGNKVNANTKVTSKKKHTLYAHWETSIEKANVTVSNCTYTGKEQTPEVTVRLNGLELNRGSDYAVTYSNNKNASAKAKVIVSGKGKYRGTAVAFFSIKKAKQEISYEKKIKITFTGTKKEHYLNVKGVKEKAKVSYKSSDLKIASVSNDGKVTIKKAGNATITITVAETKNYSGTVFNGDDQKVSVIAEAAKAPVTSVKKSITQKEENIPMKYIYNASTICEDKIPQGLCITKDYIIVSMYDEDAKNNSVIVVLDKNSYSKKGYSKKVVLALDFSAHIGGLACDGNNLWIAGAGKNILRLSISQIKKILSSNKNNNIYNLDSKEYVKYPIKIKPSFLTYNHQDGCLYVGVFDENKPGSIQAYKYNKEKDSLDMGASYIIPDRIQGAAFDGTTLYLSQSYGRTTRSSILQGILTDGKYNVKKYFELKDASLAEGLQIINGNLYILFESSAEKYWLDSFFSGKCQNTIWSVKLTKFTQ